MFHNLVGSAESNRPGEAQRQCCPRWPRDCAGTANSSGRAITDANQVLLAVNSRAETVQRGLAGGQGIQRHLQRCRAGHPDNARRGRHHAAPRSPTTRRRWIRLLTGVIGFSRSGIDLIGSSQDNLIRAVDLAESTTSLLIKYNPELTCMLVGAKTALDTGYLDATGGADGKSLILDTALLLGADQYRYPQNLPVIGAKGGPGGEPGCGSLPDVAANWPLRQLITNTGWGTGLDIRPNPGIGFPRLRRLLPGHPGDARTPKHPLSGRPCTGTHPLPRRATVRGAAVRTRRNPAVSRVCRRRRRRARRENPVRRRRDPSRSWFPRRRNFNRPRHRHSPTRQHRPPLTPERPQP